MAFVARRSSSGSRSGSSPRSATTAARTTSSTSISIIGIATPSLRAGDPADRRSSASSLGWFPTGGWKGPQYWVLPTIALAGFPIAVIARYTRASMLEVTRKDYIRTAHSKGLQRPGGRRRAT